MSGQQARLSGAESPVGVIADEAVRRNRHKSETEFLVQLGERVRELRASHGMSRRGLARLSGISERYIAQIESGRGNVSIVLLLRIVHALRCA